MNSKTSSDEEMERYSTTSMNVSYENSTDYYWKYTEIWSNDINFWQVPQLVFLVILFLFIVVGNSCVLAAIRLSETGRKTRMNFFIMHLAIADLAVGLFLVPVDIIEKSTIVWHGGKAVCKIVRFIQILVLYASTYVLVSLSVDRLDAIARPMNFSRRAFRARLLIYLAWIVSGLFAVPAFALFDDDVGHCSPNISEKWHWQLYLVLITFAAFIIPAIIITICYTVIISIIWRKSKLEVVAPRRPVSQLRNGRTYNLTTKNISVNDSGNRGVIPLAKIRTIKMTLIIIFVFVLCWSPYFVFNLLDVFLLSDTDTETYDSIRTFAQSMAPLNSAANPIIYGAFSTKICKNLRRVPIINCIAKTFCRCHLRRRQHSLRYPSNNASGVDHTQTTAEGSTSATRQNGRRISGFLRHNTPDHKISTAKQGKNLIHYKSARKSHPSINTNAMEKSIQRGNNIVKGCRRSSALPLSRRLVSEQDSMLLRSVAVRYANGKCETVI